MFDKNRYGRLMTEYRSGYAKNKSRTVYSSSFAYVIPFFGAAVFAAFGVAFCVTLLEDGGVYAVIFAFAIAAVCVYFGVSAVKLRAKAETIVKTAETSYDCSLEDFGSYVYGGRAQTTGAVFKFTYNKDGAAITDMCVVNAGGVCAGLENTRITLYETRLGEKVISATLPGKGEFRIVYRWEAT